MVTTVLFHFVSRPGATSTLPRDEVDSVVWAGGVERREAVMSDPVAVRAAVEQALCSG